MPTEEIIVESQPPVDHAVLIDASTLVEGENIFPCTLCQQPIILLYAQGQGFSLRDSDANDPMMGAIKIEYVEGRVPA